MSYELELDLGEKGFFVASVTERPDIIAVSSAVQIDNDGNETQVNPVAFMAEHGADIRGQLMVVKVASVTDLLARHLPRERAEERARNIIQGQCSREVGDPPVIDDVRASLTVQLTDGIPVPEATISDIAGAF